ncbi:MAG: hypothetical protein JNJ54_34545 [Myxococcaceae bacterium]|nr:hypothetical protein [Myxococcaceae bacterium]
MSEGGDDEAEVLVTVRALAVLLLLGQAEPTVYEYEAPKGYLRFTTDRDSIPRGAPWRVFKQGTSADAGSSDGGSSADAGVPGRPRKR